MRPPLPARGRESQATVTRARLYAWIAVGYVATVGTGLGFVLVLLGPVHVFGFGLCLGSCLVLVIVALQLHREALRDRRLDSGTVRPVLDDRLAGPTPSSRSLLTSQHPPHATPGPTEEANSSIPP